MIRRAELGEDTGMSLVEMLVTIVLIGVVSMLVVSAMVVASRTFLQTSDENQGLADAKVVMDRVARDIREARSVVCDGGLADPSDPTSTDPTCAAHLQLWIDDDSDYGQDEDEVVTWQLRASGDGIHYDVWRVQGSGENGNVQTEQRIASSLVVQTLFTYDAATPEEANAVTATMQYDALVGVGTDTREATVTARLRNKDLS